MTYRELKNQLDALTVEQLALDIKIKSNDEYYPGQFDFVHSPDLPDFPPYPTIVVL